MKIFLIRHGETTSDVDNLFGGDYDDHLTEKGIEQSKELAKKLVGCGIQIIFSSSRIRAKETANILKSHLNCYIEIVDDIRERNNYGILTGMNRDEAQAKYMELVERLKNYRDTIESAESYDDFEYRVQKGFQYIANLSYNTVAIVTHGGPIRCLMRSILNVGELSSDLADCAVIEIKKDGSDFRVVGMDGFVCMMRNCFSKI